MQDCFNDSQPANSITCPLLFSLHATDQATLPDLSRPSWQPKCEIGALWPLTLVFGRMSCPPAAIGVDPTLQAAMEMPLDGVSTVSCPNGEFPSRRETSRSF